MKILAIEKERPGLASNDFAPFLKDEARHVWELQQKGIIREIYFNQEHNAVIILEVSNMDEAKEILDQFPLVKNNIISFKLMELNPYSGLSRLFSS